MAPASNEHEGLIRAVHADGAAAVSVINSALAGIDSTGPVDGDGPGVDDFMQVDAFLASLRVNLRALLEAGYPIEALGLLDELDAVSATPIAARAGQGDAGRLAHELNGLASAIDGLLRALT